MLRRQFTRLLGAGAVAPVLFRPAFAADPLKVGFIYLGPVGDFGWTYQHDIARKAAVEHFGDKIKTTYVENVAEGPDSEKVLNDLANSGHKLIFATSFGYMNYVMNSAKKHPAVFYEHATGYKRGAEHLRLQHPFLPGALRAGRDRRQAEQGRAGRLCRLGAGARGRPGHQRLHAGHAVDQPEGADEVRADQLLVRSAEGRRRGQGADRPGLRHHHPAHRQPGAAAGRRQPRHQGVRPVHRHVEVRHRHRSSAPAPTSGRRTTSSASATSWTAPGRAPTPGAASTAACWRCRRSPTCRTTLRRWAPQRSPTSSPARTRSSSGRSRIRAAR